MAVTNKIMKLGGEWAKDAVNPPASPVGGTTYANSNITQEDIEDAWPYNRIAESSTFNEYMRRTSQILLMLESYGVMPWYYDQSYSVGAHCLGSNGKIYRCLQDHSNQNPTSTSGYWICDNDDIVAALTALINAEASSRATADSTHAALVNAHSATSALVANRIVQRDANGRAKIASPSVADDIARLDTVTNHTTATTGVHGAVSSATASSIIIRDTNGRAKVASPVEADDIARLDTVTTHAALTSAHGAVSSATASKIMIRDAAGRCQVASPSASNDIVNLSTLSAHTNNTTSIHGSSVAATANRLVHRDSNGIFEIGATLTGLHPVRQDGMNWTSGPGYGHLTWKLQHSNGNLYNVTIQYITVTFPEDAYQTYNWNFTFPTQCVAAWVNRKVFTSFSNQATVGATGWTQSQVTVGSQMAGEGMIFGIGY